MQLVNESETHSEFLFFDLMSTTRIAHIPNAAALDRQSLNQSQHAGIDSILKDSKLHGRRFRTARETFTDELRILDRLYYKNKNQHRAALFWKRVVEMKRFAQRLRDTLQNDNLEDLKASFFGTTEITRFARLHQIQADADQLSSKVFKGSWTHYPCASFVEAIAKRQCRYAQLLRKVSSNKQKRDRD